MINIVNRTSQESDVTSMDSRGMRIWSPEHILGEFQKLWDLGVRTVRISDEMLPLGE
ncbi:MAG: hypothetical protein Q7S20_06145 [Gemmatimonadaceae bacterium]|nr:hypothetical protein [Gemmatimonadaceae bacterium]